MSGTQLPVHLSAKCQFGIKADLSIHIITISEQLYICRNLPEYGLETRGMSVAVGS